MTEMGPGTAVALQVLLGVTAALASGRSSWRRRLALVLASMSLPTPFLMRPGTPLVCFLVGLAGVLNVLRAVDLYRMREPMRPARRVWHALALFDTRGAQRRRPSLDGRLFVELLGWTLLSFLLFRVGTAELASAEELPQRLLVWAICAAFAVAVFEAISRFIHLGYRLVGIVPPPLHDAPYKARSVREFWASRWNKVVGRWLRLNLHVPLARAGRPQEATLAAFAVSALIHAYVIAAPVGAWAAASMAVFFLAQLVLLSFEAWLRVDRWPAAAARLWTLAALLLLSPLFTEPLLHLVRPPA